MPFSNEFANKILDFAFGNRIDIGDGHSKVFIGLCTNNPEESGNEGVFSELPVSDGYERVLINQFDTVSGMQADFPALISIANNREISNTNQIVFGKATAQWSDINGYGLFNEKTGGSPFYYAKLKRTVQVPAESVFLFDPDNLKIAFRKTDADIDSDPEGNA